MRNRNSETKKTFDYIRRMHEEKQFWKRNNKNRFMFCVESNTIYQ